MSGKLNKDKMKTVDIVDILSDFHYDT